MKKVFIVLLVTFLIGCKSNGNSQAYEDFKKQEEEVQKGFDKKWKECNFDDNKAKSILPDNIDTDNYHIISINDFGVNPENCSKGYIIKLIDKETQEVVHATAQVQKTYSGYTYHFD